MGWGIAFGLDSKYNVYCRDGCRWKTTNEDYTNFPPWPSARQSVLDYYEGEAHRELDLIRDEFPGTAEGLASACSDRFSVALWSYTRQTVEQKKKLHEDMMKSLTDDIESTKRKISENLERIKNLKKPIKYRKPKNRIDELRNQLQPLQTELELEIAKKEDVQLKKHRDMLIRMLKKEKMFRD